MDVGRMQTIKKQEEMLFVRGECALMADGRITH